MKKYIHLLFILIMIFVLTSCSNKNDDPEYYNDLGEHQEILTVVLSPDYAPYEFISDVTKTGYKKYAGADVEVAKFIAKELGYKLKINSADFNLCPTEVNGGKADISISGFSWTPSRAENYELSKTYFAEGDGKQQLLINKDNLTKFSSINDLNNPSIKVAAQGGSLQDELVDAYLPNATKENFDSIDEALQYLKNGKYDAIALSEHTIEISCAGNENFTIVPEDFPTPEAGMVVLAKKGNTELISKINTVIDKIVEQNLYATWIEEAKEFAKENYFDGASNIFKIITTYMPTLLKGLGITLLLSLLTVVFGAILGFFICTLTLSKNKLVKFIGQTYIEVIRGIPLLLQLFVIYLALPSTVSKFFAATLALVINSGAYVSEIIRGGILAVDKGQTEAARSLGLNKTQTMFKIVLPQAIKNILPSIGNEYVTVIKETSLASSFYLGELMTAQALIGAATYLYLEAYIVVAIFYFITTFTISKLIKLLEGAMNAND